MKLLFALLALTNAMAAMTPEQSGEKIKALMLPLAPAALESQLAGRSSELPLSQALRDVNARSDRAAVLEAIMLPANDARETMARARASVPAEAPNRAELLAAVANQIRQLAYQGLDSLYGRLLLDESISGADMYLAIKLLTIKTLVRARPASPLDLELDEIAARLQPVILANLAREQQKADDEAARARREAELREAAGKQPAPSPAPAPAPAPVVAPAH